MTKPLDAIDFKIIKSLQENARLSNKELAARVHLSPSSCLERSRRLKETGVLEKFLTRIDARAVGVSLQAFIAVKLEGHSPVVRESFREHALAREEVVGLYHVTGVNDFLLHVAVRDCEHLRRLIVDELSSRVPLERVETSMILDETSRPLPIFNGEAVVSEQAHDSASSARTLVFPAAGLG